MKKILFACLLLVTSALAYTGCRKEEPQPDADYSSTPVLPEQTYDYTYSSNDELATLGRVLFYDQKLSLNNTVSCGSCHMQSKAFADGKQFSTGLQDQLTRRNSPPIVTHQGQLFWDGRASNFEELAVMPLVNHVEMKNYDLDKLVDKIGSISYYPGLFQNAYGTNEVSMSKVQSALAEFLNNFRFTNNKFSSLASGGPSQLSSLEHTGSELFWGKARCANCHGSNTFGGWGNQCIGLDESYADNGVGELWNDPTLNATFRVPTLLNIEYTAPYMHDGRFKTLEEVVEHYNSGVKNHQNLSWALQTTVLDSISWNDALLMFDANHDMNLSLDEIPPGTPRRLNLTEGEKKALVAFLKALSDPSVFTDVRFSDPFRK